MWQDLSLPLAGVVELSEVPHHLDKVVSRVFVVRAAGVRLPLVVAPVGALAALTGQPQPGVLPMTGDDHGAQVISFSVEFDRLVPDVLSPAVFALSLICPEAAGEQQQQSAGLGPHGLRWMLSVRGGEWNCCS